MVEFKCDWYGKCKRKPYAEVFYDSQVKGFTWSYLCFWHFQWERFWRFVGGERFWGWSRAEESDGEA